MPPTIKELNTAKTLQYLLDIKSNNLIIGYTSGVFDLLHQGHENFIASCQKRCDILIIGVDSDQRVKNLKGEGRPIQHQNIRVLAVLTVNECSFLKEKNSDHYISKFNVDVIFTSGEYLDKIKNLKLLYPSKKILSVSYTKDISTTSIILNSATPTQ